MARDSDMDLQSVCPAGLKPAADPNSGQHVRWAGLSPMFRTIAHAIASHAIASPQN